MKEDEESIKSKVAEEPIVIPDECGDSIWDMVLEQSAKAEPVDKKDKKS